MGFETIEINLVGVHYDKKSWIKYADIVRKKKSSVEIDPNYVS